MLTKTTGHALRRPEHKRTQSDLQDCVQSRPLHSEKQTKRLPCHHHRSYSQNFDLGDLQVRTVDGWSQHHKRTKSPPIAETEEEDCSESEEVIRKILKEREVSFARASTGKLEGRRTEDAIQGMQQSMSHLLSQREQDMKKTDTARARLRQEVLKLIQSKSSESSRVESPDTVITVKSSTTSAITVLELNECVEVTETSEADAQKTESLEERKEVVAGDNSFSRGSEADNTVIADAEALIDSDMSSSQVFTGKAKLALQRFKPNNHKLIKNALATICLAGDANRRVREDVMRIVAGRQTANNLVIAFKGTLGRHELGALYEHDQGVLRKLYGPAAYPDLVTTALVQTCYRYDSSAREFRFLQNRRFAFGMDAVSLHRRV